jgi:hypothetical protein
MLDLSTVVAKFWDIISCLCIRFFAVCLRALLIPQSVVTASNDKIIKCIN